MSVDAVKDRLAQIAGATTGIHRAYAKGPKSLAAPDLPTVVIFAGASQPANEGGDGRIYIESRTYYIRVYAAIAQTGIDGEAEAARDSLISPVRDMLLAHPSLGLYGIVDPADFDPATDGPLAGVQHTVYQGDQPALVKYADVDYVGCEHRVLVTEVIKATRARFE